MLSVIIMYICKIKCWHEIFMHPPPIKWDLVKSPLLLFWAHVINVHPLTIYFTQGQTKLCIRMISVFIIYLWYWIWVFGVLLFRVYTSLLERTILTFCSRINLIFLGWYSFCPPILSVRLCCNRCNCCHHRCNRFRYTSI